MAKNAPSPGTVTTSREGIRLITVTICEPIATTREFLNKQCQASPGVRVTGLLSQSSQVMKHIRQSSVDVLLVSARVQDPDVVDVVFQVAELVRPPACFVIAEPASAPEAAAATEAGASGFIPPDISTSELATVLALHSPVQVSTPEPELRPGNFNLTTREQQVLYGMSLGKSNSQIAAELGITEDTIKTHAKRLFLKLKVTDRAAAVATGFRWGILS